MSRSDFSVSVAGDVLFATEPNRTEGTTLSYFDRKGNRIPGPEIKGRLRQVRYSPDGSHLAVQEGDAENFDIWTYDLRRNLRSRLTFEKEWDAYPVWTPDGSDIIYVSAGPDGSAMFRKNTKGTGTREIVHRSGRWMRPYSISRQGSYLAYMQKKESSGQDHVHVLQLKDGATPVQVTEGEFDNDHPAISPDGRWIAYSSNETSTRQIYVVPFPPTGARWQITSGDLGSNFPVWRRDGMELFFYTEENSIRAVTIEVEGAGLIPGQVRTLFAADAFVGPDMGFDVSPDGNRFVVISLPGQREHEEPLTLVRNWKRPGEE